MMAWSLWTLSASSLAYTEAEATTKRLSVRISHWEGGGGLACRLQVEDSIKRLSAVGLFQGTCKVQVAAISNLRLHLPSRQLLLSEMRVSRRISETQRINSSIVQRRPRVWKSADGKQGYPCPTEVGPPFTNLQADKTVQDSRNSAKRTQKGKIHQVIQVYPGTTSSRQRQRNATETAQNEPRKGKSIK